MKVLEIPPYRKNQLAQQQQPSASPPPQTSKMPEVPPFKTGKSNDWQPTPIDSINQEFQQMQLPSAVNSDLLRRLKNSDSTAHVRRSIDCIAAQTKADTNATVAAASTPTATSSWSNVAQRSESLTSNSGVGVGSSKKGSIDDDAKGESIGIDELTTFFCGWSSSFSFSSCFFFLIDDYKINMNDILQSTPKN